MSQVSDTVKDSQREYTALTTMRLMLDGYARDNNITFDEAMKRFTTSTAYVALFDYETGLWKEGPDYLCSFWRQCEDFIC